MNTPHMSIDRALEFLLQEESRLNPGEEEHLIGCDECRQLILDAALAPVN
jgi:hypothetical protein